MINKNALLCSAISIVILSTSTFADNRTGFYLKGSVGANKFNNAKENNSFEGAKIDSNKSKGEINPSYNVGIGFYLNDYVRHDLTIGYSKANFKNSNVDFSLYNWQEDITCIGTSKVKRKSDIYSAMFNSYIDLPVTSNVMFFFGGGIGIASIKEKLSQTWNIAAFEHNTFVDSMNDKKSSNSKNKINFTYSLTTGVSLKLSDKANFDLSYSWQDFGKSSLKEKEFTKNNYKSHSVITGIRFDF